MNKTTWTPTLTALHERSLSPQAWGRDSEEWPEGSEPNLVTFLANVLAFASSLSKASLLIFHRTKSPSGAALKKEIMLIDDFQALLNGPRHWIPLNFPNHNFHPAIDAVLKAFTDHSEDLVDAEEDELPQLKARLKQLQSTLRRQSFLDRVSRHRLQVRLRQQLFRRHFGQLLLAHTHSRLHRFELSYAPYQPRGFMPGKPMYEVVRGDWDAFRSCLQRIYGNHLFGFAWQLDYTSEQGYRYFVAMLLSHDLHGATPEASTLQQRWKDITGGTGEYHDGSSPHVRSCRYRSSASHPWQSQDELEAHIGETALFMSEPDFIVGFAPRGPQKPYGVG